MQNSAVNSGAEAPSAPELLRGRGRGAHRAAQFRGVIASLQEGFDVAGRLPQALAVLDERDADKPLAIFAKTGAGRDGDIGALQQQLRKPEAAELAKLLGDRRPGEHRAARSRYVPTSLMQPVHQHVAPRSVALADLGDAILRSVQ